MLSSFFVVHSESPAAPLIVALVGLGAQKTGHLGFQNLLHRALDQFAKKVLPANPALPSCRNLKTLSFASHTLPLWKCRLVNNILEQNQNKRALFARRESFPTPSSRRTSRYSQAFFPKASMTSSRHSRRAGTRWECAAMAPMTHPRSARRRSALPSRPQPMWRSPQPVLY
jgi:hypothetical protein